MSNDTTKITLSPYRYSNDVLIDIEPGEEDLDKEFNEIEYDSYTNINLNLILCNNYQEQQEVDIIDYNTFIQDSINQLPNAIWSIIY